MTWDRSRYPDDWEEIARSVKERAGWRCENCGAPDGPPPHVLTVHHLDGNVRNNTFENLLAACQRCHLSIQAKYKPGQRMFWPPRWAVERGLT